MTQILMRWRKAGLQFVTKLLFEHQVLHQAVVLDLLEMIRRPRLIYKIDA
jgi:hypothetical protein